MSDWVVEEFEESRPRLWAIAQRMLGSASEADDAVQEVWLRLSRSGPEGIDNLGGWLTTVVSRVCLDMLRSGRRREEPAGDDLGGALAGPAADGRPEHDVLLADSIGPALLVVLDSLDPHERLAFVLHDLFGVPFAEVATIVGRSPAATRQLASRARRRLQGHPASVHGLRRPSDPRQSELVEAFLAASREGDFEALLALLDPEVVLRSDPVAIRSAAARRDRGAPALSDEVRGRDAVARVFAGGAAAAQPAVVDGAPAAVWAPGGRPRAAFVMRWRDGRIVEIDVVVDPRRLRDLEIVL
ncbi:MAG: sigma-70 family RNA polymerase sigma factor [Acidimicrobiales bacterium]